MAFSQTQAFRQPRFSRRANRRETSGGRYFLPEPGSFSVLLGFLAFIFASLLFSATGWRLPSYVAAMVFVASAIFYSGAALLIGRINIGAMMAAQCALWYILPLSYAWAVAPDYFLVTVNEAIEANLGVAISCFVVFLVSIFAGPVHKLGRFTTLYSKSATLFGFLSTGLIAFLMLTGEWGYRVTEEDFLVQQSIIFSFANGIGMPIAPMCMYFAGLLSTVRGAPVTHRLALWSIALFHVYAWIPMQRRQLAIMLVLMLIAYLSAKYRHRVNFAVLLRGAVGMVILVPVIYFLWQIFFELRNLGWESGGGTLSVTDAFSSSAGASTDDDFIENLITRPFITTSITTVETYQLQYLYGANLVTGVINAMPSAIFPWKNDLIFSLGGIAEYLWMMEAGIPFSDYANTIYLDSVVDFGPVGPFIYFPFYVFVIYLTARIMRWQNNPAFAVFFFYMLGISLLAVEASPTSLIIFSRNSILAMLAFLAATAPLTMLNRTSHRRQRGGRRRRSKTFRSPGAPSVMD